MLHTVHQDLLYLLRHPLIPSVLCDKQRQILIEPNTLSHEPTGVRGVSTQKTDCLKPCRNQPDSCFVTSLGPLLLDQVEKSLQCLRQVDPKLVPSLWSSHHCAKDRQNRAENPETRSVSWLGREILYDLAKALDYSELSDG